MDSLLKSKILSSFNIHGYSLRSDALKYLLSVLIDVDESQHVEVIKKIIDFIQSQSLSTSLIAKLLLEEAVESLRSGENNENVHLKIVDSFSLQAYYYNTDSKKFVLRCELLKNEPCLQGRVDSKADIYIQKYKMIHQRTVRHPLFAPPAISTGNKDNRAFALKCVEHLLGSSSKQTNLIVLGMLTQLKEGQFYLEDPTGAVKLNLSQASYKGGLFTENIIILAEGYYDDDIFHVTAIGFPPPEAANVTLLHYPYLDFSSTSASTSYRLSSKLKCIEEKNNDTMFVFLSDVWLDKIKVIRNLQILFAGYAQCPPACFILIGNFLSLPAASTKRKIFQDCFDQLANAICEYPPLVKQSTFVFVPGPDDPGLHYILPRPPLPQSIVSSFCKKVPNAIFTSNPCRLQYCSQEIVIFREDIVSKMCRNAIYTPWESEDKVDIPSLFVKTIIANNHLLPLSLNVAPIHWEYDHSFWLYPLPDIVVCADKYDPYTVTSTGCTFFNPGSFLRTDFCFKVYLPASKHVEDSQITDDDSIII